jgi:hypothetical protein
MTVLSNVQQRTGCLVGFGRKLSDTPRGKAVASVLYLRGLRSWITPGSYAWFRLSDDIHRAQKAMLLSRTGSAEQ